MEETPVEPGRFRNIDLSQDKADRARITEQIEKLNFWQPPLEIVDDLIGLASFESGIDAQGEPKDEVLKELREKLWPIYQEKIGGNKDEYNRNIESRRRIKAEIERILSPGNYLAHGGFTADLKSLVEDGGIMSPMARQNYYLQEEEQKKIISKDLGKGENPQLSSIFFFLWNSLRGNAGSYVGSGWGDIRGMNTDLTILVPVEVAIRQARVIGLNNPYALFPGKGTASEIALSDSSASLEAGKMVFDAQDHTKIAFKELYYVIPEDRYAQSEEIFKKHGADDKWLAEHVFRLEIRRWQTKAGEFNDMPQKLEARKNDINAWLDKRSKKSGKTWVKTYGEVYCADFV